MSFAPDLATRVSDAVASLPARARRTVADALEGGARLEETTIKRLLQDTGATAEELVEDLLEVAKAYAVVDVSAYRVGAVLETVDGRGGRCWWLGANMEFRGLPLNFTVHAEQAAVANALRAGTGRPQRITVNSAPCGHCRQFLTEMVWEEELEIRVTSGAQAGTHSLSELLPQSFGPRDLGRAGGAFGEQADGPRIELDDGTASDPLLQAALEAARGSYAPYSDNRAGAAIETDDDEIFGGGYIENAAFNPSLSAMHVALVRLHFGRGPKASREIARAALVEVQTTASQRSATESLACALTPPIRLIFRTAHVRSR